MVATPDAQFSAPLGVGAVVSESFSILFRNIIPVMILAFIPTFFGLVVSGFLNGWGFTLGTDDNIVGPFNWAAFALNMLINMVIYGLTTALLVQLAYDAKLGRPINVGRYFGPGLAAALPIAVLGMVAGILAGLGFMALIVPGLWIYAVFSMIAPVVVIERVGYKGLGRSAGLTKGYRWPIIGTIILIGICTALLSFVATFLVSMLGALAGGGIAVSLVITSAISAVGYGLGGISLSLIYARLREIKEGVSVDQIASVFD